MFFLELVELLLQRAEFGFNRFDGRLLGREVTGDQKRGRDQVRLELLLAHREVRRFLDLLLLGLDDEPRLGSIHPARVGDQIHIVLHRRLPSSP